ncbi:MAG TPA: ISAs1 family transposase [Isosphaeraceae bacterium]|nr:ISAs1 family transposase [Isosphaeraceae bacterium]
MPVSESAAFQDHFQDLKDPRVERTRKHPLINVLFIAVCGVLSGANSFAAIEEFGLDRRTWFARFLDLTNGTPSDDTFARVLARIDPGAFEKCLLSWIQAVQEVTNNRLIAIDGKTVRSSYDRRDGKAAIHMVSAWATENKLSLGQVVVNEKSNEITAIPELLQLLDVSGALVTIDAMGCQKEIAAEIRQGGGDYVLAVKQNQPTLYKRVVQAVNEGLEQDAACIDEHQTEERGHGRQEMRTYATFPATEAVDPEGQWQDLNAVGVTFSERTDCRGRSSLEARYYILSRALTAKEFAEAVRGHWGIENNLHWQLDVSFREDECRVRTDHAPANLSVIRRFALGLLKRETSCRRGMETKRLKCAASDEYREKALFNT